MLLYIPVCVQKIACYSWYFWLYAGVVDFTTLLQCSVRCIACNCLWTTWHCVKVLVLVLTKKAWSWSWNIYEVLVLVLKQKSWSWSWKKVLFTSLSLSHLLMSSCSHFLCSSCTWQNWGTAQVVGTELVCDLFLSERSIVELRAVSGRLRAASGRFRPDGSGGLRTAFSRTVHRYRTILEQSSSAKLCGVVSSHDKAVELSSQCV